MQPEKLCPGLKSSVLFTTFRLGIFFFSVDISNLGHYSVFMVNANYGVVIYMEFRKRKLRSKEFVSV